MPFDAIVSTAMFAVFIGAVTFMLPRAVRSRDALALTSALLTIVLSLVGWLMIGVSAWSVKL